MSNFQFKFSLCPGHHQGSERILTKTGEPRAGLPIWRRAQKHHRAQFCLAASWQAEDDNEGRGDKSGPRGVEGLAHRKGSVSVLCCPSRQCQSRRGGGRKARGQAGGTSEDNEGPWNHFSFVGILQREAGWTSGAESGNRQLLPLHDPDACTALLLWLQG